VDTITVTLRVRPVRRLGFDLWQAEAFDLAGHVLWSGGTRWSSEAARAEAVRWAVRNQLPVESE
jgi:hypothetical protein